MPKAIYIFITPEFPPYFGGGIARYAEAVVSMLDQEYEVLVFVPRKSGQTREIRFGQNSRVIEVGMNESKNNPFEGWLSWAWSIASIIESIKLDKVVALEAIDYGALSYFTIKKLLIKNNFQFPIITTTVNPSFNVGKFDGRDIFKLDEYLLGIAEKFVLKAADYVIAPSESAKKEISKELDIENNVHVVFPPLPIFLPNEHINIEGKKFDVLFFGRQQRLKGFPEFLFAIKAILEENHTNIRIGILGEASVIFPDMVNSEDYAKRILGEHFEKIEFLGKKKNVKEILEVSEVVVMPSLTDFSPNAVLEALSFGAKIVITDETGAIEMANLLENANHLIFPSTAGDWVSLKRQITLAMKTINSDLKSPVHKVNSDLNLQFRKSVISRVQTRRFIYPSLLSIFSKLDNNADSNDIDLTIVIPHYNQSEYLKELIENLFQDKPPYEIVVIDDGSNESEFEKVLELQKHFKFNLHRQVNGGLSSARNLGLQLSETQYVAFLDSDDLVDIKYYSNALEILRNYKNVAAVGCWIQCFNETNTKIVSWDANSALSIYKNSLNTSALIWNKEILLDLGGFDESLKNGFEDFEILLNALSRGYVVPTIDDYYFKYRVRRNSMFQKMSLSLKNKLYSEIFFKHFAGNPTIFKEILSLTLANGNPNLLSSVLDKKISWNRFRDIYWQFKPLRMLWKIFPSTIKNVILKYI